MKSKRTFNCPNCKQRISATPAQYGQQGPCPTCGSLLIVPNRKKVSKKRPPPPKLPEYTPLSTASPFRMTGQQIFLSVVLIGFFVIIPMCSNSNTSNSGSTSTVYNSSWDNSVSQVERHLKSTLRDPDSYQSVEWGQVTSSGDGGSTVRHKYRAKNGFGGYNTEERIFKIDSHGNVTDNSQ